MSYQLLLSKASGARIPDIPNESNSNSSLLLLCPHHIVNHGSAHMMAESCQCFAPLCSNMIGL